MERLLEQGGQVLALDDRVVRQAARAHELGEPRATRVGRPVAPAQLRLFPQQGRLRHHPPAQPQEEQDWLSDKTRAAAHHRYRLLRGLCRRGRQSHPSHSGQEPPARGRPLHGGFARRRAQPHLQPLPQQRILFLPTQLRQLSRRHDGGSWQGTTAFPARQRHPRRGATQVVYGAHHGQPAQDVHATPHRQHPPPLVHHQFQWQEVALAHPRHHGKHEATPPPTLQLRQISRDGERHQCHRPLLDGRLPVYAETRFG